MIFMAEIIYKKGCEGQNKLSCIEGIEIKLRKGQKALIYPKYAERPILQERQFRNWSALVFSQLGALKVDGTYGETWDLLKIGSPAAQWVAQFRSQKYGMFILPSLWAAMEIQCQRSDIDALAKTIDGADLLRDYTSCVASCCRSGPYECWCAYGSELLCGGCIFRDLLAVPCMLY